MSLNQDIAESCQVGKFDPVDVHWVPYRDKLHVMRCLDKGGFPIRGEDAPQALLRAIDAVAAQYGKRACRKTLLQACGALR